MDEERPRCKCHNEPMSRGGFKNGKQQYKCAVKHREGCHLHREKNRDKLREKKTRYRDKLRAAGMCMRCGKERVAYGACWRCREDMVKYNFERGMQKLRERGINIPELDEDAKLICLH